MQNRNKEMKIKAETDSSNRFFEDLMDYFKFIQNCSEINYPRYDIANK